LRRFYLIRKYEIDIIGGVLISAGNMKLISLRRSMHRKYEIGYY
jgi:hypothetical protein